MKPFNPLSPSSNEAIRTLPKAINALEREQMYVYPAVGATSLMPRFMLEGEAEYYGIQPIETKAWIEQVVRANMGNFDDDGWSEKFAFISFDFRVEDNKVMVIPWDKRLKEHDYSCAYELFPVGFKGEGPLSSLIPRAYQLVGQSPFALYEAKAMICDNLEDIVIAVGDHNSDAWDEADIDDDAVYYWLTEEQFEWMSKTGESGQFRGLDDDNYLISVDLATKTVFA